MTGTARTLAPARLALVAVLAANTLMIGGLAACSSDERAVPPATTELGAGSVSAGATTDAPDSLGATEVVSQPTTPFIATTTPSPATTPAATEPAADTGVPGLDSEDEFCAAWSRFGGSWQVVLAASAFARDPSDPPRLEVLASTVVADAYEAMFDVWPSELAAEETVVADEYFGAFRRRSADALAALSASGADEGAIERLGDVWLEALASRSPSDPVPVVDVPGDLADVVATAGVAFAAQRPPFTQDPSMVIVAATPQTDAYLASSCPDRGSIAGGDVTG